MVVAFLRFLVVNAARMVLKMRDDDMEAIVLDLTAEENQYSAQWGGRRPKDSENTTEIKDYAFVLERYVGFVEALWTLVACATWTYKQRYKGSSSSSGSSKNRHKAEIRDSKRHTELGKRLK